MASNKTYLSRMARAMFGGVGSSDNKPLTRTQKYFRTQVDQYDNPNVRLSTKQRLIGGAVARLEYATLGRSMLGRSISGKLRGVDHSFKRQLISRLTMATTGPLGLVGEVLAVKIQTKLQKYDNQTNVSDEVAKLKRQTRGGQLVTPQQLLDTLEKTHISIQKRFDIVHDILDKDLVGGLRKMDDRLKAIEKKSQQNIAIAASETLKKLAPTQEHLSKIDNAQDEIRKLSSTLHEHESKLARLESLVDFARDKQKNPLVQAGDMVVPGREQVPVAKGGGGLSSIAGSIPNLASIMKVAGPAIISGVSAYLWNKMTKGWKDKEADLAKQKADFEKKVREGKIQEVDPLTTNSLLNMLPGTPKDKNTMGSWVDSETGKDIDENTAEGKERIAKRKAKWYPNRPRPKHFGPKIPPAAKVGTPSAPSGKTKDRGIGRVGRTTWFGGGLTPEQAGIPGNIMLPGFGIGGGGGGYGGSGLGGIIGETARQLKEKEKPRTALEALATKMGESGSLKESRAGMSEQLKDPRIRAAVFARMEIEVGSQGEKAQQAWLESVFNRADSRFKGNLLKAVDNHDGFYPGSDNGKWSSMAQRTSAKLDNKYSTIAEGVAEGSNLAKYGTGNASGTVGFGRGKARMVNGQMVAPNQTAAYGGERYGIEVADEGWAKRRKELDAEAAKKKKKSMLPGMRRVLETTARNTDLLKRANAKQAEARLGKPAGPVSADDPIGSMKNVRRIDTEDNARLRGRRSGGHEKAYLGPDGQSPFNYRGNFSGRTTKITTKSGKSVWVDAGMAHRFKGFIDELESRGYDISQLGGLRSGDPKQHGMGRAIDINPDQNPMLGDRRWPYAKPGMTDMPENVKDIARKYGLAQLGFDRMHFEGVSPTFERKYMIDLLREGKAFPNDPRVKELIDRGLLSVDTVTKEAKYKSLDEWKTAQGRDVSQATTKPTEPSKTQKPAEIPPTPMKERGITSWAGMPSKKDATVAKPEVVPPPAAIPRKNQRGGAANNIDLTGLTGAQRIVPTELPPHAVISAETTKKASELKPEFELPPVTVSQPSGNRRGGAQNNVDLTKGVSKKGEGKGAVSSEATSDDVAAATGYDPELRGGGKDLTNPGNYQPESAPASPGDNGYGEYRNCFI